MTVCIAFVRHGMTAWNQNHRLQGRADIPLCDEGIADLERLCLPDCLTAIPWRISPLRRAAQTAQILHIKHPLTDPRLIEMDWGSWEGETVRGLRARLGASMQVNEDRGIDFTPPGGESPRQVQNRLRPLLKELLSGPSLTGAITHKGVIRALLALATDWNMLGVPNVRLDWRAAHIFSVDGEGQVAPHLLNLPLIISGSH